MTERLPRLLAAAGLVAGTAASIHYYRQGLTLAHYDAKAHLVVARRVLDSLTPEYSQIGAVWLPLPHLLNLVPVQNDYLYRTGLSGVAFSVLAFALACWAIGWIVLRITGSGLAAIVGVAAFGLLPDVLYLQATPMTEPLLFGLTFLAVALVYEWTETEARAIPADPARQRQRLRRAGWALVLACMTRYEAWFVTAAALVLAAAALWWSGRTLSAAVRRTAPLAMYPALAIAWFFVHSWFTTGEWFVTGGFYVADNPAHGDPWRALVDVVRGTAYIAGWPLVVGAGAGLIALVTRALGDRSRAASLVMLAVAAFLALPAYAFYEGHPFRVRYLVAPAAGAAVLSAVALGTLPARVRMLSVVAALGTVLLFADPFNANAPMVLEAQWDVPNSRSRATVTACLMEHYAGERILASMGSLAHYMQELSHRGIHIRDFVHEGNKPYWQDALVSPAGRVGWILIEEQAEGGDILAGLARTSPGFLAGFVRVCADGGVALYGVPREPTTTGSE